MELNAAQAVIELAKDMKQLSENQKVLGENQDALGENQKVLDKRMGQLLDYQSELLTLLKERINDIDETASSTELKIIEMQDIITDMARDLHELEERARGVRQ
jgi:hypothetical protein